MINKIIYILLLVFVTILSAENTKEIKLQLNWQYQFQFAGFIAAKEKGFYRDAGFNVEIIEKIENKDLIKGLLDNEYDFLLTSPKFLLNKKAKNSLMFLANYFKQSPLALITQKDIISLSSLKDKKIMINEESLHKDTISLMFDKFKIDKEKDIKRIEPSNNIEDFISKKIDAMAIFTTNELYELNKRNINYNIFYPANYGLNAPDVNLISTQNTYTLNKKMVQKFIAATKKGWEYALNNSDELVNIIYTKYSKKKDIESLKYEALKTKELILANVYAIGSIDLDFYSAYLKYLKKDKKIDYLVDSIMYIPKNIEFTKKENKWLNETKELDVLVNKNSAPFIFYNEEKMVYDGAMIEYLNEITKLTNIKFKYKESNEFSSRNSRVKFISVPSVSIIKEGSNYIHSSSELITKKVVTDSFAVYNSLKSDFPTMDLTYNTNYNTSINAIKNGSRDILLTNLITAKYWSKVKIDSDTQIIFNEKYNIPYFLEFDLPLDKSGLSVIRKGIKKITENKKLEIYSKWTLDGDVEPFDYTLIYKIVLVICFIILFVVFWNINLNQKVNQKTNEINELMKSLECKVKERTKSLNEVKEDLEGLLGQTMSSIKYASLIQHAIIPESKNLKNAFEDSFVIWEPKDIVGGDLYLFEVLKKDEESLLMVVDCTGHGVPGAFVTMLVKAIEREVLLNIINSDNEVSTAKILKHFDETLKALLKKEKKLTNIETGFDCGILYYNKKENYIKYSGAKIPLFYIKSEELFTLKSNRRSIGYETSREKLGFYESKIDIDEDIYLYIATDGYIDQTGGERGFSFGKRKFTKLLQENYKKSFDMQKDILLEVIKDYQELESRDDDMTVVGIKLSKHESKDEPISSLQYNI